MARAYFLLGKSLSEVTKFSSRDIKPWLEKETSSIFIPVHEKAQKLLEEMRNALEDVAEISRMLLDNSAKEIEKRNMKTYGRARALNKLARLFLDRWKQLKAPEKVFYDSLREFAQETQRAFAVTDLDIRNWFPRVSPFFILDRRRFQVVFEKAKLVLRELNDFVSKEYVKTKTLEETFLHIDKLHTLEGQLANLSDQKEKVRSQNSIVEKEITETRQKMTDLKSKGGISQLDQVGLEIGTLNSEVKHGLRHLQKPFVKLQSLTLHGGGSGITPEEAKKLDQYLNSPFEAFATEASGYPLLKQILQKLDRALMEGKLKLKPDKTRKAKQAVEGILSKSSLDGLYQKCVAAMAQRSRLSTSSEVAETRGDLSRLQQQLENLERKGKGVESEQSTIEQAHSDTVEKIRNHKSQIEKNILSFMGKRVRIE